MSQASKKPVLLMVDDDDEDIYLTRRAFCNYRSDLIFHSALSGAEMFDFLHCRGKYETHGAHNYPDVVLLDINIPKENGFTVLQQLKQSQFAHLPVVMHTTSFAKHDVLKAYQLGASSYLCKSDSTQGIKDLSSHFCDYWFSVVKIPKAS